MSAVGNNVVDIRTHYNTIIDRALQQGDIDQSQAAVLHSMVERGDYQQAAQRLRELAPQGSSILTARRSEFFGGDPRVNETLSALESTPMEELAATRHTFVAGAEVFARSGEGSVA